MKRATRLFIALALLFVSAAASPASAQGFGGPGLGPGIGRGGIGYGIGLGGGTRISTIWDLYLRNRIPIPPYFALHPPVYYSAPVARSYGYSPFAYSGDVPTPEIIPMELSKVITNPYVQQATVESQPPAVPKGDDFTQQSLMIVNPFVTEFTEPVQFASVEHAR